MIFNLGMVVVVALWAGLSILKTSRYFNTKHSLEFVRNGVKTSGEQQFCVLKCLVDRKKVKGKNGQAGFSIQDGYCNLNSHLLQA